MIGTGGSKSNPSDSAIVSPTLCRSPERGLSQEESWNWWKESIEITSFFFPEQSLKQPLIFPA